MTKKKKKEEAEDEEEEKPVLTSGGLQQGLPSSFHQRPAELIIPPPSGVLCSGP